MRTTQRLRAILATLVVTISCLSAVTFASESATAAATHPCSGTTIRSRPVNRLIVVPRIDAGVSLCYVQQGMRGSYVYTLQVNILVCYAGTPAAASIKNSGGADSVYGAGTRDAFKWIQKNVWGLSGSNVDGVYGPYARDHMLFALWHHNGNFIPTETAGGCSRYTG
ncbi:hypothetical protein [Streptomyces sp. NPDC005780]|uniref:hypothetical protein n=1 Tax=Streptomyces sp. NPDC005780 TaxID=3364730 RepID=UPI0036B4207D